MQVIIVPRSQLTPAETAHLSARISAPEHANDNGACRSWDTLGTHGVLFVASLESANHREPFGALSAGGAKEQTIVAWWIDSTYRGKHLGSKMIDSFAKHLKSIGVTGIGKIAIDTFAGKYHKQSCALARKLQSHFE